MVGWDTGLLRQALKPLLAKAAMDRHLGCEGVQDVERIVHAKTVGALQQPRDDALWCYSGCPRKNGGIIAKPVAAIKRSPL